MRQIAMFCAALLAATAVSAAETTTPAKTALDPKLERLVQQSLPVCADLQTSVEPFDRKLPEGLTGSVVSTKSEHESCVGRWLMVTSRSGSFYFGAPWFLDAEGATLEEKLKNFTWQRMQSNFTAVIDRKRTADGLFPVTLIETTERGKVPLEGEIDADGTVFFLGRFRPASGDIAATRTKSFEPYLAASPRRGSDKPKVTIIEFADFQCPSCRRAQNFLDPILQAYGDRVQYIRYDLPLSGHPWAFSAAIAGRAIYRQKPDLFWQYKKQVYSNQEKLSAFTIDEFARSFAQDNDLDMARYDADVASEQVRSSILSGVGTAFSNDIRATPTYMVNGLFVDAGDDGKNLAQYVAKVLK